MKKTDAEGLERECCEDSQMVDMLSNVRYEHQAVSWMDAEHQRVHQNTNEKSDEMVSAQDQEEPKC